MAARKIIHLDLDAFYCAVEELRDPTLRGKAFAVGGKPDERGVVASCSYAARQFGVHSAMPMAKAIRLCRDLVLVPPHRQAYMEASHQVMEILRSVTPLVEQISIDEAFLDVGSLNEEIGEIAKNLQARIHRETRLPCSLGAAVNKLTAKIANDVGKAAQRGTTPPRAITIVPPGSESKFLAPLAVQMLWGVGPKTAERLRSKGVYTIGQVAELPEKELIKEFGRNGYELAQRARGLDDRPVSTEHEIKSISQETTFQKDVRDEEILYQTIRDLVKQVVGRLCEHEFIAGTIRLKIRWSDFTTLSRQFTLAQPTDQESVLVKVAETLFSQVWKRGSAVRLLGVGASNLKQGARQLSLWDTPNEREQKSARAMEQLYERFGALVIQRGHKPEKK
ncbi:MAG: DNA polymerase IV [Anaerolineaceae bacterium]|nr:DNA polymerase IV [Anaerolineaceae bacterium]